jgi:hypothetical protein
MTILQIRDRLDDVQRAVLKAKMNLADAEEEFPECEDAEDKKRERTFCRISIVEDYLNTINRIIQEVDEELKDHQTKSGGTAA